MRLFLQFLALRFGKGPDRWQILTCISECERKMWERTRLPTARLTWLIRLDVGECIHFKVTFDCKTKLFS